MDIIVAGFVAILFALLGTAIAMFRSFGRIKRLGIQYEELARRVYRPECMVCVGEAHVREKVPDTSQIITVNSSRVVYGTKETEVWRPAYLSSTEAIERLYRLLDIRVSKVPATDEKVVLSLPPERSRKLSPQRR